MENLLVSEILFQHDAVVHDSAELGMFHNLFRNPADPGDQADQSGSIHDCFHELVTRRGIKGVFFIFMRKFTAAPLLAK